MNKRILSATLAIAMSAIATPALFAAPVITLPVHAKLGGTKMVSFMVRNDSKDMITLKAGDVQLTLKPGQTSKLKVADGTDVTTVNATPNHAAGSSLATANSTLSSSTLLVN